MSTKLILSFLLLTSLLNVINALENECPVEKCKKGEPTVCALDVKNNCFRKFLTTCEMGEILCQFDREYTVAAKEDCEKRTLCEKEKFPEEEVANVEEDYYENDDESSEEEIYGNNDDIDAIVEEDDDGDDEMDIFTDDD